MNEEKRKELAGEIIGADLMERDHIFVFGVNDSNSKSVNPLVIVKGDKMKIAELTIREIVQLAECYRDLVYMEDIFNAAIGEEKDKYFAERELSEEERYELQEKYEFTGEFNFIGNENELPFGD